MLKKAFVHIVYTLNNKYTNNHSKCLKGAKDVFIFYCTFMNNLEAIKNIILNSLGFKDGLCYDLSISVLAEEI